MIFALKLYYIFMYVLLSAQTIFYHIAMSKALESNSLDLFVALRKTVDPVIGPKLRFIFISGLLSGGSLLLFPAIHEAPLTMAVYLISLLLLVADLVMALTKSVRLNKLFISEYPGKYMPAKWQALKLEWLHVMLVRGIFNMTGLALLLLLLVLNS